MSKVPASEDDRREFTALQLKRVRKKLSFTNR